MSLKNWLFLILCFKFLLITGQNFERVEYKIGLNDIANNNGVAVADFDNDNDLDLFIVAHSRENPDDPVTYSRLMQNNNDGTFEDITFEMGLFDLYTIDESIDEFYGLTGTKFGVSWGDYNNDSYPDLVFTFNDKLLIYRNNQANSFTNVTTELGFNEITECGYTGATWFDYDNDGLLDLFLCDWGQCNEGNALYRNLGGTVFENVTESTGLNAFRNFASFTAFPYDFNKDGFIDLYVTNDFSYTNRLYINNENHQFTDQSRDYGLDYASDDMGIAFGDFDLDQQFDIYITTRSDSPLFKFDSATSKYINCADDLKVKASGWGWGTKFADFDLDGDEDLIVANGFDFESLPKEQNIYYENLNAQGFNRFDLKSRTHFGAEDTFSMEFQDFDYDNDGDLDLVLTNTDNNVFFYENKVIHSENTEEYSWLEVKLEGTLSNRDGIGTSLEMETSNGTLVRYFNGVGMLSQSLKPVHFGFKEATELSSLKITWPSGQVDIYNDISKNVIYKATEASGLVNLNVLPSTKIEGCTDPNSCNYNPEASIDDGSCTYLESKIIEGAQSSMYYNLETYSCPLDSGQDVEWHVKGGRIVGGQGTNSVSVEWHVTDSAEISARVFNSECSSEWVSKLIALEYNADLAEKSIARIWNELLLEGIRGDFAKPTVHARNLFHSSILMYDIWAVHDDVADTYFLGKTHNNILIEFDSFTAFKPKNESINEAISYAMYRLISHRYSGTPGFDNLQERMMILMQALDCDVTYDSQIYQYGNAAALGNYVASQLIDFGLNDGSREASNYDNAFYEPINLPLVLDGYGNQNFSSFNPNNWQPLTLELFIDQSGNITDNNTPDFLSPEWGSVYPFALKSSQQINYSRNNNNYKVYLDPGEPPLFNAPLNSDGFNDYKSGFAMVSVWGSHLDPNNNVLWDISPGAIGNLDFGALSINNVISNYNYLDGGDFSMGHQTNPVTGNIYESNMVKRGDYTRVLAEFWADGPDSETPPGHWFTILNYVNDNPLLNKNFEGQNEILSDLEWDVKSYFALGGAMHDTAIAAWSVKGWYDYIRPVSAIRYMCSLGQSSNPEKPSYNTSGIPLIKGYIELIDSADPLVGLNNENLNKIKVKSWRGHDYVENPKTTSAGVDWILGERWWPYQRPSFVTPPFAGYVSGHSTYSRAAAEVLTAFTGTPFFPGGMGEFKAPKDDFLVFEKGPAETVVLQWATYADAADQCSLSRIWGGIHPPTDDIPGRIMGEVIGKQAFEQAKTYFNTTLSDIEINQNIYVFPNPINPDRFVISGTASDSEILLFDFNGRQIPFQSYYFNETSKQTELSLRPGVASGVYLLKVSGKSFKLIVN